MADVELVVDRTDEVLWLAPGVEAISRGDLFTFPESFPADAELAGTTWRVLRLQHLVSSPPEVRAFVVEDHRPASVSSLGVLARPNVWLVLSHSRRARIVAAISAHEGTGFDPATIGGLTRIWVRNDPQDAGAVIVEPEGTEGTFAMTRARKVAP